MLTMSQPFPSPFCASTEAAASAALGRGVALRNGLQGACALQTGAGC